MQIAQGFTHSFQPLGLRAILFQRIEVGIGLVGEKKIKVHFVLFSRKFTEITAARHFSGGRVIQAFADFRQSGLVLIEPSLAGGDFRVGLKHEAAVIFPVDSKAADPLGIGPKGYAPFGIRSYGLLL